VPVADLPKISADAHVNEPHDLWYNRLDEGLRDKAPHHIKDAAHGGWTLVVNGENSVGVSRKPAEIIDADEREAAASPEVRFEMMRVDGISAEIVHPTIGLFVYRMVDGDAGTASCRVYNDWIYERLGGSSPRIKLTALIPTWDVDDAIAEVERMAALESIGGLMLPIAGTPPWNDPQWERLWSAITATGKPAVMHQSTGHSFPYTGLGAVTVNMLHMQSMAPRTAALFSCSGILERHPELHVVLVEVNGGWMAWTMTMLDENYVGITSSMTQPRSSYRRNPELQELPSFYIRRQLHATFQRDPIAIFNRQWTGDEALMWGNDFPHNEGTYPDSLKVLEELLVDVPDESAAKIVGGNAAHLFGFDPSVMTPISADA
jgi:predicted TIM-barrel fold metal-dependent hydrolase